MRSTNPNSKNSHMHVNKVKTQPKSSSTCQVDQIHVCRPMWIIGPFNYQFLCTRPTRHQVSALTRSMGQGIYMHHQSPSWISYVCGSRWWYGQNPPSVPRLTHWHMETLHAHGYMVVTCYSCDHAEVRHCGALGSDHEDCNSYSKQSS